MTTSTTSRSSWRRVNGLWTTSLGTRGSRIRLFEKAKNGVYYRDVTFRGQRVRKSLHTSNRDEALRLGKLLLSRLDSGQIEEASSVVTLHALWKRFQIECSAWLDNSKQSRKDDERSAKVLIAFFGEKQDIALITEDDLVRFRNARLKGGIELPVEKSAELAAEKTTDRPAKKTTKRRAEKTTKSVRERSAQADLELLRMMCRWATTVRVGGSRRLLHFNPLQGIRFARERNELRPVATIERFAKTRQAMIELRQNEQSDSGRARWFKIELAFVLAEATGRRLNSIRLLRWEDVDLKKSEIRWRADSDKKGREWVIPVPESLRDELRQFRVHLGAIAGWVFPSESDGEKPMDRYQFDKWLRIAEDHAELKKLEGGLWHPYRRKWATERKDLPIKDVMAAGGWLDVDTLLKSYQQADRATLLRVMNEPRKLSDGTSESVIGE